jgi:CRISPR-associated protein Cas1
MTRTLYVTEQGSTLSRKDERLVVQKAGKTLADVPASKVIRVFIFGNVSLTTPAIAYLLKEGKDVAFLSNRGRYYGRLISSESKGAALRRDQLRASDDMSTCLELSKRFVTGKLRNQRRLLHRRPGPRTSSAAKKTTTMIERIQGTGSLEVLRGVEGYAARLYFSAFGGMLEGMKFVGRRRRPPPDPVNSMLSLGYTMLTYEAFSAVSAVGLDPYVGFYHRDTYGRPSLALDIMEEFRPAVVDLIVLGAVNRGQMRHEDFEVGQEAGEPIALLKEDARKRFFGLYEYRMLTQITHRSRTITYREALHTQARQVVDRIKDRKLVYEPVLLS